MNEQEMLIKKLAEASQLREELAEAKDKIATLQQALRNLTSVDRGGAALLGSAPSTKKKGK